MTDPLQLTVVYEQGEDGWIVVSVPEVPGTISQGRTRKEARANVIDALQLMLRREPGPGGEASTDREPLTLTIAG